MASRHEWRRFLWHRCSFRSYRRITENPATNSPRLMPFFDGHNDALLRLLKRDGGDAPRAFLDGEGKGQLDLPMAVQGGFAGGMFAIFVPSPRNRWRRQRATRVRNGAGRTDAASARSHDRAGCRIEHGLHPVPHRTRGERTGPICRTADDIRHCMDAGALAAVLHIEGAEAIDPEFASLDVLHPAGLRSLGPVWSRPNAFGHGVPFRFPSSPDTGPGLTDLGKELVRACNRLRILIDLSHLNETRLLGRRRAQRRAAGRHPLQRPCARARIRAISPIGSLRRSARPAAWSA